MKQLRIKQTEEPRQAEIEDAYDELAKARDEYMRASERYKTALNALTTLMLTQKVAKYEYQTQAGCVFLTLDLPEPTVRIKIIKSAAANESE